MTTLARTFGALGALGALLACSLAAGPARVDGEAQPLVLGTFDSRAVAMAWFKSEPFQVELSELFAGAEEARRSGDATRLAEFEAAGPALQERMHRQGFSTAPVDDILERLREQLPALAEQAGVDAIVSKWDLVYQAPGVTTVDVSLALVDALQPTPEGRRTALEIMQQEPVPLDELDHDH